MNGQMRKGLRAAVGLVAASAALVAFAPAAQAADTVVLDQGAQTQIVINPEGVDSAAKAAALSGHTFTAVRLASYDSASHNGNALESVGVGSDATVIGTDASAMEKGALQAVLGTSSLTPGQDGNPMNYVAKHWLGVPASGVSTNEDESSSSGNYSGKLRDFVTQLTKQSQYNAVIGNPAGSVSVASGSTDTSATIAGLTQGLYMIVDTTGQQDVESSGVSASIPMLVGTPIVDTAGTSYTDFSANGSNTLGSIVLKSNTPTIEKHMIGGAKDGKLSIGSTVQFKITGSVPLTTGFDHFRYVLSDTPSAGLSYVSVDSVRVDDTARVDSADTGTALQTLTEGTDYTLTTPTNAGDPLEFNLSPSIVAIGQNHYKKYIHVTYTMKINNNADSTNVRNGIMLSYSSDTANQPTDDNGTGGTTNTVDKRGAGESITIHLYGFTLKTVARSDNTTALDGAVFNVEKDDGGVGGQALVPLKFIADGTTGNYKLAEDQNDGSGSADVVTSSGAAGDRAKGEVHVEGLSDGDYRVVETTVPGGYSDAFSSTFDVHIKSDDSTLTPPATAENPAFTNDADTWTLVDQGAWRGADMGTHVITVQEVTSATQLPLTGGAGAILVVMVIAVLLMVSGAIFIYTRRGEKALAEEA